jgi:cell wall-associated NlpC family hydrolase
MNEQEQRAAVVAEAMTWLNTPYHHRARIKGAGVDCGQFVAASFEGAGMVQPIDIATYPQDWALHQGEERYLQVVQSHSHEIEGPPSPGDIAVWRFGRAFSHGSIVVEWPLVIHAYFGLGVVLDDATANQNLASRPVRFFSPWGD